MSFLDGKSLEPQEGKQNLNEKTINELGRSTRSSHQENMVPNGQVGNIQGVKLKTGEVITVGPGRLKKEERLHYFQNPSEFIGQVAKYKHFPKGVKDKPRFPTFECLRPESDLDPSLIKAAAKYRLEHLS
ncbi:hypothetical protein JD514_20760 [Aeromonas caviae]|uniref:hypothetical protein n=1 Tax=Aeromonas caviae TaxID=648 RepID=UPI00191F90FE|nr:hypothetical protein [Aeromonas caviae]MBL0499475.1 hypothetical protein [Aeromonas caviae]